MKCNGISRKNKKTGICGTALHPHQIYCHVCGLATPALKTDLSAKENIKLSWEFHKKNYQESFSLGLLLTLAVYIPLSILVALFWHDYWHTNLILLFYIPFALIPLAMRDDYSLKNYLRTLSKLYLPYLSFILVAEIYFFLLKVICDGYLLSFMVDPVLHIVRLIMVLYGITCAFAVPFLMADKKMNPIKAIILSIKAGHETRWQQFFTLVAVAFINLIGALCLLAGLLYTLPLSYKILRRYYQKMVGFELFTSSNPTLE
ncbi:MAG: hypothetical protein K9N06_08895 [Candidatus Cloacimonetes bacterium]|nr:hypothetical protein [Candidatus Cloacimonadota bacterium]